MIRVDRGDEHPELPVVRADELARIASTGRRPAADELGDRYKCARATLRARQHHTCCYCEKFIETKHATVEHVRPKAEARRSGGRVDPGYWWLAWTWQNLLFCCQQCNGHKGVWYPLRGDDQPPHHGHPLAAGADPPGHERPLLLDPTVDDPIAHIQFRPVMGRWIPQPRDGSRRGYETIRRVQLDRDDLRDLYTIVASDLEDSLTRVRAAMASAPRAPAPAVSAAWDDVLSRQLRPGAPLCGLRYDLFDHHFPRRVRLRWGVSLDAHAAALTSRRTGA